MSHELSECEANDYEHKLLNFIPSVYHDKCAVRQIYGIDKIFLFLFIFIKPRGNYLNKLIIKNGWTLSLRMYI